jgi:hypothetical protein
VNDGAIRRILRQSVEEVLEKMFFVTPVEPAISPPGSAPGSAETVVRLRFEGRPSGVLDLRLTTSVARSIATDFLGEDAGPLSDQRIGEVVCEMANMICGSVLSRVEDGTVFRLAPALILAPAEDTRPEPAPAADGMLFHAVGIGEGSLTVVMNTERPECPGTAGFAF